MFRQCCPNSNSSTQGRSSIYFTEYDCIAKYCATNNVTTAENWGECVEAAAKRKIDDMNKNGTKVNSTTINLPNRCEWIDYDLVKKGRQSKSQAAPWAVNLWVLVGSLTAATTVQLLH